MQTPGTSIEQYELLIPAARMIYEHTSKLSWQLLFPLFLMSIVASYTVDLGLTGAIVIRLKRLVLVAVLLTAFPMIAEFCQSIGVEIAKSIDDMTGIDFLLQAAADKAASFSISLETLFNMRADIISAILVSVSFLILSFARVFLLAFQHFYWLILVVLGPFFILCSLFESSEGVTKNLFKSMIQVSAWPIIWSVLSAFLKCLPFAQAYSWSDTTEKIMTITTLNLVIAVALLFSPFLLTHLTEGTAIGVGESLKRGVLKTAMLATPKGAVGFASKFSTAAGVASKTRNFTKGKQ